MIQHRASLNNVFINNTYKLKNKHGETQHRFVLNLKKTCVCFSKQQNNENIYLKKQNASFISTSCYLLIVLIVDFITLIRQKVFEKDLFIYKNTIKKVKDVSKKASVFIKKHHIFFYIAPLLIQVLKKIKI